MTTTEYRSGFVSLVGPANAGKSTILNVLAKKKVAIVSPKPQTTRDRIIAICNRKNGQLVLVDTPGFVVGNKRDGLLQHLTEVARNSAGDADVVAVVVDASIALREAQVLVDLEKRCREHLASSPKVVVLNKIDLCDKRRLLLVIQQAAQLFPGSEVVPVSARERDGLDQLEQVLYDLLPVGPQLFPDDWSSDQTEEFFIAEVIREKAFRNLRQELPYSVGVRIEEMEMEGELLRVMATIFVERESQKGIVLGAGGQMVKRIGSEAREELERLLGKKIFLKTHVRVEANWTESERGLRKLGYEAI